MKYFKTILFIALFVLSSFVQAQSVLKKATVTITGELTTPFTLNEENLKSFKKTEVIRKDKDGHEHTYSGILVADLLGKAGTSLGSELRGENLTKYALAEASDGYQVIFALAELDPEFTDRPVILAYEMDHKPLPLADGPFRIIVQGEKKPARCIKQLNSIKIVFAK